MIAVLGAALLTLIAGMAVSRAVGGRTPLGASYLYGCGVITLGFTVLPWTRWSVAVIAAASVVTLAIRWRHGVAPSFRPSIVDALTAVVLTLFAALSTVAGLWEWDAWAIWAMKARVFFTFGGIDWGFLEAPANSWVHADYPLLVPANLALPAVVSGSWSDRWLGLIGVFMLVAAVLVVRDVTSRRFSPPISAAIALTLAGLGASWYVGTAETPLIALSVAALACLHAGETTDAAILLGLAASTKNEGVALLVAVLLAHAAAGAWSAARRSSGDRWTALVRLWPAAVLVLPWFLFRALHDLPTDLTTGRVTSRLAERLSALGPLLAELAAWTEKPALWTAIVVVAAFFWRRAPMLFAIVALQAAFCVGTYLITPYAFEWHIATSWERVSRQLAALAAYAAQVALATQFSSAEVTHAQARSEQQ